MVEVFKSPINLQREASVREIAKSAPIVIGANASARATIAFAKTYTTAPFVYYSISCADEKFGLSHYITSVTTTGFVIVVENQDSTERSVIVTYDVTAN